VFGLGNWFWSVIDANHYERVIAEERAMHAEICKIDIANVLDRISIKFCAAWNVSVPPYDKSVAEFLQEEE
jgi:hypothetical protein